MNHTTQFIQQQLLTLCVVLDCDAVCTVFKVLVFTYKSSLHHSPEQQH
jgi:hypothetical protein